MGKNEKYKLVITLKDGTQLERQTSYSYHNWQEVMKLIAQDTSKGEKTPNAYSDEEGVTILIDPNDEIRFIEVKNYDIK
jgi:hypothetical protein